MKWVILFFVLVLSSVSVSGDLSVSCFQDSDCSLALADDSYFCEESFCQKESVEEAVLTLEARTDDVYWDFVRIEEKKEICPGDTCVSFAPKKEKERWFFRFIDFLFYL